MDFLSGAIGFLKQGGWMVGPILATILVSWGLLSYKWLMLRRESKKVQAWETAVAEGKLPEELPQSEASLKLIYSDQLQFWQTGLSTLHTLGSILPMLGLLGTVTGIITVFNALGFGSGEYQTIAKGIGEALVNTQLGLLGAVPTLVGYNALCNRADHLAHRFKKVCVSLLEFNRVD